MSNGHPEKLMVDPELAGRRIDQFLSDRFPDISRGYFQRRIDQGEVFLDGNPCKRSDKVIAGDQVSIVWTSEKTVEPEPKQIDFEIIYEDQEVLVIGKPPNLVVHPSKNTSDDTLVHGLLHYDESVFADMLDSNLRPGIVHRLDKDTSGVMVVAKNMEAWRKLKEAFKQRVVDKTYLAIVSGDFGVREGHIEGNIGRHPVNRTKMAVVEEGGKHAGTRYRVIGTTTEASLLEISIETGRTHQIRVHFANIHHPVVGDHLYGGPSSLGGVKVERQMLHAWKLSFPHPRTGVSREYRADLPGDFYDVLCHAGLPLIRSCRTIVEE